MEPKFQTSFIPKKVLTGGSGGVLPVIPSTNIFSTIASTLFVVTLVVSAGVYGYTIFLKQQIAQADRDLVASRAAFEPETLHNLITVSSRIMSAQTLLNQHVVISALFNLLEATTVKKVKFSNFSYQLKNNVPSISMEIDSEGYNALAYQSQIFSQNPYIKNPSFSNFELGDNGTVKAKFQATLDPSLISYKHIMESLQSQQSQSVTPSVPQDTQTTQTTP
jgi:hypothetical protein